MKLLLLIILTLSTYCSSAQNLAAIKMYCGTNFQIQQTIQNDDGSFYGVGSYTPVPDGSDDSTDAILVKFDANFNMLWHKLYVGNLYDVFAGIRRLSVNRLLVFGHTQSTTGITTQYGYANYPTEGYLVFFVTDTLGNIIHGKNYGYGLSDNLTDLEVTRDGRILFIGTTFSHNGDFATNPKNPFVHAGYVACLDTALNKKWIRYFNPTLPNSGCVPFYSCLDKYDNLVMTIGNDDSLGEFQGTNLGNSNTILCIDSNQNILWKRTFMSSSLSLIGELDCDSNNNLLVSGTSGSIWGEFVTPEVISQYANNIPYTNETYSYLCLLDSNRNMVWSHCYPSNDNTYPNGGTKYNYGAQILRHANGIWLISKIQSEDYNFYGKTFGETDLFALKLDSSGKLLAKLRFGGAREDNISYQLVSWFMNKNTNRPQITFWSNGGQANGNYNDIDCSNLPYRREYKICEIATWPNAVSNTPKLTFPQWLVAPNPNNGQMNITISEAFSGKLSIVDLKGSIVYMQQLKRVTNTTINSPNLPDGEYLVVLQNKQTTDSKKIIIKH